MSAKGVIIMGSMHCRLYDENLVHNIIMSTGMTIADFLQNHPTADADDICEYLELHADTIIEDTIEQLNNNDDYPEKDDINDGIWPILPDS
jgi:hypothetical protein